jgi:hypothetical protein
MESCSRCGVVLAKDDKLCPNCGAEVAAPEEPKLVEALSFEHISISERGITFRIKNTGTAPLTVMRLFFDNAPAEIVSASSESGVVSEGLLTLQPGDVGEVTFTSSFSGASDLGYLAAVVTASGKRYETTVVYM